MVDYAEYSDADRPRALLSPRDRAYLTGESDVEPRSQHEREIRADLRTRVHHGVLDWAILNDHLQNRDRDQALAPLRDPPRLDPDASTVNEETADAHVREMALRHGFRGMLALLYRYLRGVGDPAGFRSHVASAVGEVEAVETEQASAGRRLLGKADVTLEVGDARFVDMDTVARKARGGSWDQLSRDEVLYVLVASAVADGRLDETSPLGLFAQRVRGSWTYSVDDAQLAADAERLKGVAPFD